MLFIIQIVLIMKWIFTTIFYFLFFTNVIAQYIEKTIPEIQGTSTTSPCLGKEIETTAIVTALFFGEESIKGFFLQDENGDNNTETPDGIFVYVNNDIPDISVGDKIKIRAKVSEYNKRTQLSSINAIQKLSAGNNLPVTKVKYDADNWDWRKYNGMLLEFDQTLYVTSNYMLQAYGQLSLNPERIYIPTEKALPGSTDYFDLLERNARAQITLDDGITSINHSPIVFADENGTRRTGELVDNLKVLVDYYNNRYVVYPFETPVFYGNSRPLQHNDIGNYNLKVCSFNLEHYLANNYGQGFGADNEEDAEKQHTKIIKALLAIDADIYGLLEIQQGQEALKKLTNALNAHYGAGTYDFINDKGTESGTYSKAAYVYKSTVVSPYKNLKSNDNPTPINRKKAQAFTLKSNDERFIFSINHFKAKSGCANASGDNLDIGDGQSCYNGTRLKEVVSTANFLKANKSYFEDEDVLIMGDLNSYMMEDPIRKLEEEGYINMLPKNDYTYVYRDEIGSLDYALANISLAKQITGVTVFHINADEPQMFEYAKPGYQPNMYRCSDHDPVIVGLSLGNYSNNTYLTFEEKAQIYPTVINDHFVIENANNAYFQLYTVNGKILFQKEIDSDHEIFETEALNLDSGIYIARLFGEGFIKRIKLILK